MSSNSPTYSWTVPIGQVQCTSDSGFTYKYHIRRFLIYKTNLHNFYDHKIIYRCSTAFNEGANSSPLDKAGKRRTLFLGHRQPHRVRHGNTQQILIPGLMCSRVGPVRRLRRRGFAASLSSSAACAPAGWSPSRRLVNSRVGGFQLN